jgi:glycosyltransferase involved in cell wall biosynthesis
LKNILAYNITKQPDVLSQLPTFNSKIGDETIYRSVKDRKSPACPKISAVIITYNEEAIIARTLSKLGWCDEVIIIDSGSTDKTVEICKEYGCTVHYRVFQGFGEQKKYGVSKAKHDWILCIDSDELLTDPLIEEIQKELNKNATHCAGFAIPLTLVFMNKVFKYGKEANIPRVRLFNKTKGNWDGSVVHEKVVINGPVKPLQNKIYHYSYSSYSQFLKKIDLYSTLSAQKLLTKKSNKSKLITALCIPFNFLKSYIIERNFLNGYHGFAWAVFSSLSHFIKYLKLNELKEKKDNLL